ncbi:MAG: hypothetical protein IK079_04230 [Desulfovibrio sp.]|nr:hypothetical protein [Desulfovibrio sp.]
MAIPCAMQKPGYTSQSEYRYHASCATLLTCFFLDGPTVDQSALGTS